MEQMNITLNKEEISKPFVINQYSKNFNYKLNIFNSDGTPYVFKVGDYIVMEVAINNIAIILSGVDFSIVGNVATFNIPRELTLNSGKGTYNVSIVNDSDNSRIACFSREIVVKSNSIDEDTVSTDLIVTTIENLNNATTNANSKLTELNQAIANGDLEARLEAKVDKVIGKGLSENDFTNTYKAEVDKVTNKQDKIDNSLNTTNKTIVGAINELINTSSIEKNGYYKDTKSGMIIQWGRAISGEDTQIAIHTMPWYTSSATITFPLPFPNTCSSLTVTVQKPHVMASTAVTHTGSTVTLSTPLNNGGSNCTIDYIAIGY